MDQRKIGLFLKELRKEKDLTQEALAEQLHVAGRTISRWETGRNMPDISIIVELAEFYGVSISEIIDGERLVDNMNDESRKIADYASTDKEELLKRISNYSGAAVLASVAAIVISIYDYSNRFEAVTSTLFMLAVIFILSVWMLASGRMAEMRKNETLRRRLLIGAAVLLALTLAVTLVSLGIGQ